MTENEGFWSDDRKLTNEKNDVIMRSWNKK